MIVETSTNQYNLSLLQSSRDTRIVEYKPLIPPQIIEMQCPLTVLAHKTVTKCRNEINDVLQRRDDRLVVVVGPCSIHDTVGATYYAKKLLEQKLRFSSELVIVMRTYFEKPRTTVGWKGLINDPNLDNSCMINKGLQVSRKLLKDINELGMPVGSELLDTISPQYLSDFLGWGAVGARTTESQLHRELVSGISFPVGFKNGTNGSLSIAIDAIKASNSPHHFMGVTNQGLAAIVVTSGNPDCHVIMRGSNSGPNYDSKFIREASEQLDKASIKPNLMIDFSHGNSQKKHKNQIVVCQDVAEQISNGNRNIIGVMIESNIHEGRQDIPNNGLDQLKYGVSVTDACISFDDTIRLLESLADSVRNRRRL